MPPRKDPIETMSPADKLLRVGIIGGVALLLVLATVSSYRDGPGQSATPEVAEAPAAQEDSVKISSADAAPEPAPEAQDAALATDDAASAPDPEDAPVAAEDVAESEPVRAKDAAPVLADAPATDAAPADAAPVNWREESPLLASADIDAGESAFRQCSTCHQYAAERNAGGPHLVGIVGRPVGAVDNWRYSGALQDAGGVWTPERLEQWLTNPDDYLPGNRMAYPGVRDAQDRINIIGFLAAQGQ